MKIGFNYKRIFDAIIQMGVSFSNAVNNIQSDINNLDTRITTVENSVGSSDVQLEEYTMQLYNPQNSKISDIFCKKIDDTVFLHFYYNKTLSNIDLGMIEYNFVELGSFTLGNSSNNNMFDCKGYIACHYKLGAFDSYKHKGLLNIYIEDNKNVIKLIIDKDDIELWNNISDLETYIEICASGIMNASEITNS